MSIETIKITDRDQWLKERVKDVTSTEVSALYGLSPYKTDFELFHEKRDGLVVEIQDNDRMKWGRNLEPAIAQGVADDQGWKIAKLDVYMRDIDVRMGSSFDYQIVSSSDGPGILEIKNVDWLQFQQKWIDHGNENYEAPEHIELQVQHQLEISGFEWAAIAVLVGGNEAKVLHRNRDRGIGADIRAKVTEFWERVKANRPPNPDYSKDAEFIIKSLATQVNAGEILEADVELETMIQEYLIHNRIKSDADAKRKEVQAKILKRIDTAAKVITSFGSLACGEVKGKAGTLVTPDLMGQIIGASKGYRNFKFFPKGDKA